MNKLELEKLLKEGKNKTQIGEYFKCHRTTVTKRIKEFEISVQKIVKCTHCKLCNNEIKDNERNRTRCQSCNTRIRRFRAKKAAVEYKGGKCNRCEWQGAIAAFEFHHWQDDKEFSIGSAANKSWSVIKKEIDKCELLCSNCHRIEHSKHEDEIFLKEVENYKGTLLK